MSKFSYHQNGEGAFGAPIYEATHVPSGKILGLIAKTLGGNWTVWVHGAEEDYPTRSAAAERLLLVAGVDPVSWSALPSDPFDGISA